MSDFDPDIYLFFAMYLPTTLLVIAAGLASWMAISIKRELESEKA